MRLVLAPGPKQSAERGAAVAAVDDLASEIVDLTCALVRIPTETKPPHGDEGPGQRHLDRYLREQLGWETDVFLPTDVAAIEEHPGWWPGLDYTDRPNVVAVRRGTGGGRSLVLNGHMDVVAAGDPAAWRHDPYGGVVADGRIYGRGSVDMKGGIAAMVLAVEAVERAGIRLRGDVIVESVVNEELGGYNGTLACIARGSEADAAVVTEGTRCRIMPAHKGGTGLRLRVPGRGAHANLWWRGVSALDKAMVLKRTLVGLQAERAIQHRSNPYFSDPEEFPLAALVDTVWSLSAGRPDLMSPPSEAVLDFWLDALPGESLEDVIEELNLRLEAAADADPFLCEQRPVLERQTAMRPFQPTAVPLDHPFLGALAAGCRAVDEREPRVLGFSSVCDAMMFNLYSETPAVVFGPGDVAVAHGPDEYVEIDELVRAAKILALTIVEWCGVA